MILNNRLRKISDRLMAASGPQSHRLYRALILIGTIVIMSSFYPVGDQFEFRYDLNQITHETIIAPFNFPILKSKATLEDEREKARLAVPLLFHFDQQITNDQLTQLGDLFNRAKRIRRAEDQLGQSREQAYRYLYDERITRARREVVSDSLTLVALRDDFSQKYPLDLNAEAWNEFFKGKTQEGRKINYTRLQRDLERIVRDILAEGVLQLPKRQLGDSPVAITIDGIDELADLEFMMDQDDAWAKARTRLQARYAPNLEVENSIGSDLLIYFIRPNLVHDAEITLRRQQEAIDLVPVSKGIVLQDERIVDANTRVTEEVLEKLNSLAAAQSRLLATAGGIKRWLPRIGMLLITAFILAFFYVWMYVYRNRWFRQTRFLLLTSLILILVVAMGSLFHHRFGLSEYLIPFTVAAMALTILFDARTALIGITSLALIMGFMVGNKIDFALVNLLTGAVAIYSVRQLRRRRQIFTAVVYIITAYAITITAVEFLKYTNLATLGRQLMFASINGLLSPIMVYGLIGMLEVVFGTTTNLTLLELSDFTHPLLRKLSREANGTFSHSIVVGNLVEAAANAIGANSLLARVGAYYHDIGKLARPEYFIENQFHSENPHDTIAPHLSAKVVRSHVKEGLQLAREYGLPISVSDFIPMHHGTARIEYFYQKALREDGGSGDIKEDDFRYFGPKPNTKETGLLMLCEAIEAATRSLEKPTLANLQQMIDTIIDVRMSDGQLNECPLTLEDLGRIKGDAQEGTGIISVLKGIYHVRIPYRGTEAELDATLQHEPKEAIPHDALFEGTPTE